LIVLAGCSGPNRTTKTTLLGTGVGAGVGAIAGGSKGTAIGAGTGALSGFLLGRYEDKREDRLRREAYGREVNPVRYREIDSMSDQEYADFMRWRAENEADYDAYLRWKAERDRIEP
jgi:hypothetical protein